jgi:hypothetical protein
MFLTCFTYLSSRVLFHAFHQMMDECWILSWAVTLEISARRRSDKPLKNL